MPDEFLMKWHFLFFRDQSKMNYGMDHSHLAIAGCTFGKDFSL